MPAPTCTCIVCGNQTSKRQSLAIEVNGQTGRACRNHPEVAEYLQKKFESVENEKALQQAEETIRCISLTSFIRVQQYMNPIFPTEYYLRNVRAKYGVGTEQKVREELAATKPMTDTDVVSSILAYSTLVGKK